MRLGYETTDKKIEIDIYGLNFEIKNIEKLQELDNTNDEDIKGLETMIDTALGEGAVTKINEQRVKDGYKEMDSSVALQIIVGIAQAYTEGYMQPLEKSFERVSNYNREARRYNNRNRSRGRYGRY